MSWPGAVAIESCVYTASHGEQPGFGQFTMRYPPGLMAGFGDLTLSDGYNRPIVITDCKIQDVRYQRDHDGDRWYCRFVDRRWRWDFNAISGVYNDLDFNGKLVPWRIASPTELMLYCLRKMEENLYSIDMPPGVDSTKYANAKDYFTVGINTPPSGTNPKIVWQDAKPAAAAASLAIQNGRRFVMDPLTNKIIIARPGVGADLPADFLDSYGGNANQPATPAAIGIVGSPILYQARLLLVPVCKEWHGQFVPPDLVSWRPMDVATLRKVTIHFKPGAGNAENLLPGALLTVGAKQYSVFPTKDPAVAASSFASQISADPNAKVTATAQGSYLTLIGKTPGDLDISVRPTWLIVEKLHETLSSKSAWLQCLPPSYANVRPTDRLNYAEARQFAADSLWRAYRIADWGLGGPSTPIFIPGYGEIIRRQDLLLQPAAVEQVTPQPYDLRQFKNNTDIIKYGVTWDFYNGYSRNRSAAIYGSIARNCNNNTWMNPAGNTPDGERINVSFQIDPVQQLVVFSQPVYKMLEPAPDNPLTGGYDFPTLVLETGVQVADPTTGELIRPRRWYNINLGKIQNNEKPAVDPVGIPAIQNAAKANVGMPTATDKPPRDTEWYTHEDVWSEIIGTYDFDPAKNVHVLTGTYYVDEQESANRSYYYLSAHINEHIVQGGATAVYQGLRPISLDGAIQQVTWEIGDNGARTTASRRMEHAEFYPPYPVRRRRENLEADKQAAIVNNASKHGIFNNLSVFKKAFGPIANFLWKS